MKVNKLKQLIAALISAAITVSAIPYSTLAVEGDNSGTGDWNGVEAEGSTWDIDHQGYRLCIVTEDGTPVTNAVDILYSNSHNLPSESESKYNYSSRTNGNSNGHRYYWTELGFSSNNTNAFDTPPAALYWDGGPVGNGAEVNSWFTTGENGDNVINAKNNGSYIFTFVSDSDKDLVNNGKNVFDVVKSEGYLLTVEPITWFKPCNSDNTKKYPYYLYGTINNICKWYYVNNSLVDRNLDGATAGGFYINVIHCLWTSMYIESDIIGLNGVTSASALTAYNSSNIADMYAAMQSMGAGLHVYRLGKSDDVTAVIWYGKEKPGGGYDWILQKEKADAERIVQLNRQSSKSYGGLTYIQYALMGTHDNPTGWRLSDSPNTVTAAAFSENVPDESSSANGPVIFMNGGESGEKRYFSVKNTDEAELVLENYDNLKSAHFVFCYKMEEAENVLYYPKGMRVITSVLLHNNTEEGMYSYNFGGDLSKETRASVLFTGDENGSEWTKSVTNITVEAGGSQLVWIEWVTPSDLDVMTLTAEPSSGVLINDDEQVGRIIFTVYLYDPLAERTPPDPRPTDKSNGFSVSTMENIYGSNETTDDVYHSWTVQDSVSWLVVRVKSLTFHYSDGSSSSGAGPEPGKTVVNVTPNYEYIVHTAFYIKTSYTVMIKNAKSEITPSNYCPTWYEDNGITYMASGYGIYTSASAEVCAAITNINATGSEAGVETQSETTVVKVSPGEEYGGAVVGLQAAESLFPEFYYGKSGRGNYNRILKLNPEGEYNFTENKYSTLNDTVHYTPLWYPDNADYRTLTNMLYGYTPLGALEIRGVGSNPIRILGNVYDDWHVAVVG